MLPSGTHRAAGYSYAGCALDKGVVPRGQVGAEMQPVLSSQACPLQGCISLEEGALSAFALPEAKAAHVLVALQK